MADTTIFRDVSKPEFEAFLAAYPRPLERNMNGIFDSLMYHDFSLIPKGGNSYDCVVAFKRVGQGHEDEGPGTFYIEKPGARAADKEREASAFRR